MKPIETVRQENLAKIVLDLFEDNQTAAATKIGYEKPTQLNHWLHGQKNMSTPTARKIEKKLQLPENWMDTEHNSPATHAAINAPKGVMFKSAPKIQASSLNEPLETNVSGPLVLRAGRAVAVVGEVQGGPDGYISIDEYPSGGAHAWVQIYTADASAYGLLVRGDSMRPRIKSGEHIIVEPGIEALPGDDVVVRFADGTAVVKELLWIRDGEVCLGSISDGIAPITRPTDTVISMHRVAAIIPRGSSMYHAET